MAETHLRRRVPNFVSVDGPMPEATVTSLEELTAIPWLKTWATKPQFIRFSRSNDLLMVELDDGTFWALAYFLTPAPEWLPKRVKPSRPEEG